MRLVPLTLLVAAVAVLAAASPSRAAGLLAPTDQSLPPLRVTDHLVDVSIRDGIAITNVTQKFRNDTKRRLEATYVFPLPENADLTDFQMSFNGRMAKGRVLPAEEAARIYESIVRQAKDPGLIEFIGRRLLQMRVFPIEPDSTTTIKVRYQQVCRPISGMTGYHYPLRTRKTAGQAYGTVRFNVELDSSAPLKNIWSPTHAVEIVRPGDERTARIAYEANGGSLEDDFLLLYDTDSSDLGLGVIAYKPDGNEPGHFVLMLTPKQLWPDEETQPQDVVFVLDTSGSMAGDKLTQAKSALRYCIDRLDEHDRFSVVRFSTGFDTLFDEVRPATPDHRATARKWVDEFSAAGGTNIADTLAHVVAMRPTAGDADARTFVVVFLTDGRGNRSADEIMNVLADAPGAKTGVRIFPFGVGHDVNTKLVDRLADAYTGRPTYVQPGENLELVLGDFFSVISRPVLTNLRLSLPVIGATQRFPATLGDLYHGQQIVLAGRFGETATGPVRLTATRGGERVEYAWPDVAFTHTAEAEYVPGIWAGRKIAYLIDQIRTHGESSEMVEEILVLSQEFGIQTPYTSWLVDPERAAGIPITTRRGAPAMRGRAGGVGGGGDPREQQARRLLGVAAASAPAANASEDSAGHYFVGGEAIDLLVAGKAVTEEEGRAASLLARKNAELRELRSRDRDRLDTRALPFQRIGTRWYNRIGRLLVDERFAEDTELVIVRFGSDAYFEIVRRRPDLRRSLAAAPEILVMATDDRAVLVLRDAGTEQFSEEEMQQLGLVAR
jgi:Ca-activated chloride channel family protein